MAADAFSKPIMMSGLADLAADAVATVRSRKRNSSAQLAVGHAIQNHHGVAAPWWTSPACQNHHARTSRATAWRLAIVRRTAIAAMEVDRTWLKRGRNQSTASRAERSRT